VVVVVVVMANAAMISDIVGLKVTKFWERINADICEMLGFSFCSLNTWKANCMAAF
jgi:hypothetical protein